MTNDNTGHTSGDGFSVGTGRQTTSPSWIWNYGTGGVQFANGNAEVMRLDVNNYLLIGKTATNVANAGWEFRPDVTRCTISGYSPGTEFFPFIFYNQGGVSSAGNITVNAAGTAVAYNSGSDYRLKENAVPLTGALDRVAMFKPLRFNFIGALQEVDGFFAHEAAEVVPEAVTGEKDGEEMQSIDQGKLVPLLVAAIQELTTRLEALEA
jgi:hypothetical protein